MRLATLFEDLDDKDEFDGDCDFCQKQLDAFGQVDNHFHIAHSRADRLAADTVYQAKEDANLFNLFMQIRRDAMYDQGYVEGMGDLWVKKPLKENLDDKDEFMGVCDFCDGVSEANTAANLILDMDKFHTDHGRATEKARSGGYRGVAYNKVWLDEMLRLGYRRDGESPWAWHWDPRLVKEDLDDRDEFAGKINGNRWQAWDSTGENQHWIIQLHNDDDTQRMQGEYYVFDGKMGGMDVMNFSRLDDETARRMLVNAIPLGIGEFIVDWDEAVENAQRMG